MSYANLYETPGPRGARRNRVLAGVIALVLLALAYVIYVRFDAKEQWSAAKWTPFLRPEVWTTFILPGLAGTLAAAVAGVVLAGLFGLVFATARLSDHRWIRWPAISPAPGTFPAPGCSPRTEPFCATTISPGC